MESIIKVALMLLTDRRSGEGLGATRIGAGALYSGFAVITLGAGLACALAALWLFLSPIIGSAGAALAVAGVLLITSGILMIVARSMFQSDDDGEERPAMGEELMSELLESFTENKGMALMAALVAGLVAGSATKK